MANGNDFPVSAEQYIAGLDITACVRESKDRRHVRLILAPFIKGEGADGAGADQIESLLALAGVEATDWDRAFIRQSVPVQPKSRLFFDPSRHGSDRRIGAGC